MDRAASLALRRGLRGRPKVRSAAAARGRAPWPLAAVAVLTAAAVNLPLVYIFARAAEGGWSAYLAWVGSARTLELLLRTLALAAGVTALALAVAVPMAWLVSRTDLPGRRFWAVVGALPLVFPSYVAAFTLVAALGPRGYLQAWLAPLGVGSLPGLVYGYSGAVLVLGLFTYPYIYLLLVAALRDLDPALEESSRSLGVGRWRTFARVVLPQLRPALYGGSLLVVLYALSDFGGVSIVRYNTFTLAIYNAYRGLFDRSVAAALATALVLTALVFIALEAVLLRSARPGRRRAARPAAVVPLGRWKRPAVAALALLAGLNVALPAGVIAYWGVRALWVGNPLGGVWLAAGRSLSASAVAALAAVALAVPVALWAVRHPSRPARVVERLSHAGYALPGIVIALALVFFATRLARPLYQTLALLVAAYVVRFLPEALAATRASLLAVAPVFEEAARSLGRGPLAVLGTLTLPLIRPGLAAGAGLVFLTAMKELPATLILRPTGFETLATTIWSAASEGIYSQAALPGLLLLLASGVPVYLLIIRPALAPRGTPPATMTD